MHDPVTEAVCAAHKRLTALEETRRRFIKHLSEQAGDTSPVPSSLSLENGTIRVDCFGVPATATARAAKNSNGEFLLEYRFCLKIEGDPIEVWRFYLTTDGHVVADPERAEFVCDFDNTYISRKIAARVLQGAINGPAFTPSRTSEG